MSDFGQAGAAKPDATMRVVGTLPNGSNLYRRPNGVGGHEYFSDEVGGGVFVWDTSLLAADTLLAVLVEEARRQRDESHGPF